MATHIKYSPVTDQRRFAMALPKWLFPTSLALLMIDAVFELAFISTMVSWLTRRASGTFAVSLSPEADDYYRLAGEPANLLVDQGHTSNGAAGTAFVLVGVGGMLMLWLRHRAMKHGGMGRVLSGFYHIWVIIAVLSALLSLGALVFTFVLTNMHAGQNINVDTNGFSTGETRTVVYTVNEWTPENWFNAMLKLDLREDHDRRDIQGMMTVIRGWKWNLIPLFLLGLLFAVLVVIDALATRKPKRTTVAQGKLMEQA